MNITPHFFCPEKRRLFETIRHQVNPIGQCLSFQKSPQRQNPCNTTCIIICTLLFSGHIIVRADDDSRRICRTEARYHIAILPALYFKRLFGNIGMLQSKLMLHIISYAVQHVQMQIISLLMMTNNSPEIRSYQSRI